MGSGESVENYSLGSWPFQGVSISFSIGVPSSFGILFFSDLAGVAFWGHWCCTPEFKHVSALVYRDHDRRGQFFWDLGLVFLLWRFLFFFLVNKQTFSDCIHV